MPSSATSSTPRPTIRDASLRLMRELGLDTVFGNPGSTELPMFRDFPEDSATSSVCRSRLSPAWPTAMPRRRAATRANSRMLAALGATPVQMPLPAVPESLSKGMVDGNSGLATSAWAGETGFDTVVETYEKAAKDAGGIFHNLPDVEYQRWIRATDPVDDDWVKAVGAKGADGKRLLEEARNPVKQYSR